MRRAQRRRIGILAVLAAVVSLLSPAGAAGVEVRFRDVPDGHTFKTDIEWLATAGITRGCNPPDNDRFCPEQPVTRAQMAAFLVRALELTDMGEGNNFTDDNSSIFEDDITKLATAGITRGCNPPENDRFCPEQPVTRAQMAAFLRRALPSERPSVAVDTVVSGEEIDLTGAGTGTGSFDLGGTVAGDVETVEVSLGDRSGFAELDTSTVPATWRIEASAPFSGTHTYLVEATDRVGRTTATEITVDVTVAAPDELLLDPDTVVVTGTAPAVLTSYSGTTGLVVFAGDVSSAITVDTILVGQVIAGLAPNGFLRRVTAVNVIADETVVATEQATLLEAVRQAEQGMTAAPTMPQAKAAGAPQGLFDGEYGVGIEGVLAYSNEFTDPDYPGWTVNVSGEARADAELFVNIDLEWGFPPKPILKELTVSTSGGVSGDASITGSASTGFEKDKVLASQQLGVAAIGPVPVTLEGELIGEVGGSATGTVGVAGSFDVTFEAKAQRIDGVTTITKDFTPTSNLDLTAEASVEAKVGLKLQLELLIADAVGPSVTFGPELIASATLDLIQQIIPWQIRLDLVADLGITGQIPVLDVELIDESFELWRGTVAVLAEGTINAPQPAITLTKQVTGNDDEDRSLGFSAGDTVHYEITLTNSGDEAITNAAVTDPLISDLACTPPLPAALAPLEQAICTGTYTVTKADVVAGSIATTASAVATDSGGHELTVDDTHTLITQDPDLSLEVVKELVNADEDGSGGITENDTLTYTVSVWNDGNLPVRTVRVADPLLPGLACNPATPVTTLYRGELVTCSGTYVVSAADVAAGTISNTASSWGSNIFWGPVAGSDTNTAPIQQTSPSLWVQKWLAANDDEDGSGDMTPGDTLNFSVRVWNNGTEPLTDVIVTDELIADTFSCAPSGPADLAVGGFIECSGSHVVSQDDYDRRFVTNTASASGFDPDLSPVSDTGSATVERTKPYVEEVLAGQPAAYWRMADGWTGTIYDSVGGFHGSHQHGAEPVPSFVGATNDGAMEMGCCDTDAVIPLDSDGQTLTSDYFTFEMWAAADYNEGVYAWAGGGWDLNAVYDIEHYTTRLEARIYVDGQTYSIDVLRTYVEDAHHLVLVRDDTGASLYLNGEVVDSVGIPDLPLDWGDIHRRLAMTPQGYRVDEMVWYKRALNADEIALHYYIGANPGTEPLSEAELGSRLQAAGFSNPESMTLSFTGPIFEWATVTGDSFFRYTDFEDSRGNFLSTELFDTPSEAIAALNLSPWGNGATLVQDVTATTNTSTYIGYIAGGVPHGYKQYLLLDVDEFSYSTGVPY